MNVQQTESTLLIDCLVRRTAAMSSRFPPLSPRPLPPSPAAQLQHAAAAAAVAAADRPERRSYESTQASNTICRLETLTCDDQISYERMKVLHGFRISVFQLPLILRTTCS